MTPRNRSEKQHNFSASIGAGAIIAILFSLTRIALLRRAVCAGADAFIPSLAKQGQG